MKLASKIGSLNQPKEWEMLVTLTKLNWQKDKLVAQQAEGKRQTGEGGGLRLDFSAEWGQIQGETKKGILTEVQLTFLY